MTLRARQKVSALFSKQDEECGGECWGRSICLHSSSRMEIMSQRDVTIHTRATAVRMCNFKDGLRHLYSSVLLLNKIYDPGLLRD